MGAVEILTTFLITQPDFAGLVLLDQVKRGLGFHLAVDVE